jgi:hypothetical protein
MFRSRKKYQNIIIILSVALVAFLLGYLSRNSFGASGFSLSGAAGAAAQQQICDSTPLNNPDPTGIVLADPLNFRIGPGLNYAIVTVLEYCTPVSLLGRTGDSAWLLVKLEGNLEGWVYSYYIFPNMDISDLEVATGYGGPNESPDSSGKPGVSVVIQYNQAVAFVTGMPANEQLVAILAPSTGSGKSLTVASGWTDAQGNATLIFDMPATWADGSNVTSGSMTLTIFVDDVTLTGWITYYTN